MKLILFFTASLFIFGCAKKDSTDTTTDSGETAQQIGDVMASMDEMGGSTGTLAYNDKSAERIFARLSPDNSGELTKKNLVKIFQPEAQATTCSGAGFGSCGAPTANTIIRTFNGCTVANTITFAGTVTLTWNVGSSACNMQTVNVDYVTRAPSFTVTGRRSATLSVSTVGTFGQKLAWTSGVGANKVFAFTSDGINRKFTNSSGAVLFNHTTQVTSAMTVTGTTRTSRVINGGLLKVTNNNTSIACDFNPVAVTWGASCNCPVSGTWNGACSSGINPKLVLTGCGTGTYTEGSETSTVTFDRCGT